MKRNLLLTLLFVVTSVSLSNAGLLSSIGETLGLGNGTKAVEGYQADPSQSEMFRQRDAENNPNMMHKKYDVEDIYGPVKPLSPSTDASISKLPTVSLD